MKKKVTHDKGTIFGYWGYNRDVYTNSNMNFVGPGYNFTLAGVEAKDNPEEFSFDAYFNINKITIPQFNVRIGYYFKKNWALSIGYDHMKYIFRDKNEVLLSGNIETGIDSTWSGIYNSEPVITDRENFHYENSDGLNYIRFELTRTDRWLKTGNKDWFVISSNLGVSAGGLLSFNDFIFAGKKNVRTISMSGYGLSLHAGARFEFFRHVFLEAKGGLGFHHQLKVRNRPTDPSAYTKHAYGYGSAEVVLGFFLYLRSKNGCDSCPNW